MVSAANLDKITSLANSQKILTSVPTPSTKISSPKIDSSNQVKRGQRQRSHSRSSSSPSPPPSSSSVPRQINKEKRRSFNHKQSPHLRGRTFSNGRSSPDWPDRPSTPHAGPSRLREESWTGSGDSAVFTDDPSGGPYGDEVNREQEGFSTFGAASVSSGAETQTWNDRRQENLFVSARGEETENEDARRRRALQAEMSDSPRRIPSPVPRPSSSSRPSFTGRRPNVPPPLIPSVRPTIFPFRLGTSGISRQKKGKWDFGIKLTSRRCEDGLVLGAVGFGAYKLFHRWSEKALAGEIGLLIGFSILYINVRVRPSKTTSNALLRPSSPLPSTTHLTPKERHRLSGTPIPSTSSTGQAGTGQRYAGDLDNVNSSIGEKGCTWATEEREYRDCPEDGVLFALLFGPLIASGLLHDAYSWLGTSPISLRSHIWRIEPPQVLPSTPIRPIAGNTQFVADDTLRALSALVTSRRNLVQLFTLCSFVLLVHLTRSLLLEVSLNKLGNVSSSHSNSAVEKDLPGDHSRSPTGGIRVGTYWARRGEWKRNASVVGFSTLVTGCCILVKIVTAIIGRGVWIDMSFSDIVIATLFYQFSLYVCVRLARKGFTLGELAIVCNAATALLMETVNLTRMKIALIRTPYIKTYRLPTPLIIFQLALIPGSLLTGFLLSPLLYLSRHLAQKPAHRLRFPDEKATHRRLLALGFYGGAFIICAGLLGTWTRWCLNWRDPFIWVVLYMMEGKRWWTRLALIGYWGALAMISVAGWSRQLNRARRHRRYVVPGTKDVALGTTSAGNPNSVGGSGGERGGVGMTGSGTEGGITGVASSMMDAADQRIPTLSVNARRKFFHALAVVMFVPGIAVDPAFTHLSFSVAFAAFNFAEYIRYFALWPFGVSVHLFLNEFLDNKDSGTAILSHFYLLAGCAAPLWLEGSEILSYFGVIVLGIGDALASIVGRRVGKVKWNQNGGKTLEGSIAFMGSVLVSTMFLWAFGAVKSFNPIPYAIATALTTLLEAVSAQNDNLILPMYGWAIGTLLGS